MVLAFAARTLGAETPVEAALKALVIEAKELRLSLERTTLVTSRVYVTLQRVQVQQEEVTRLSRELEGLRDMITRMATQDADSNMRLPEGIPPEQRKMVEEEMKRGKARFEAEREANKAREADLASRLRTEQIKLSELHEKLDALDRILDPARARP